MRSCKWVSLLVYIWHHKWFTRLGDLCHESCQRWLEILFGYCYKVFAWHQTRWSMHWPAWGKSYFGENFCLDAATYIFDQQPSNRFFSRIIHKTQLNDPRFKPCPTLWGCSKKVGRGGQSELGLKLEDKLQLNLFRMRWSSLLLELLKKDRSVCVHLCAFLHVCGDCSKQGAAQ